MKLSPIVSAMLIAFSGSVGAASYEVQEIPLRSEVNQHFAVSIDDEGLALSSGQIKFNPPVDLSIFDVADHPSLVDPDAAAQGNFNATDLSLVAGSFLGAAVNGNTSLQKLAPLTGFQSDGVEAEYVFGFDSETEETNGFTFSLDTRLADSVGGTHIVGSMAAPFEKITYVDENQEQQLFVVNEFSRRGFVQVDGQVSELAPSYTRAGGFSFASAINDSFQVAGVSSIAASDALNELIDNCEDPDERGDQPEEACKFIVFTANAFAQDFNSTAGFLFGTRPTAQFLSAPTSFLDIRPTLWQLGADGEVLSSQTYELLHEPDEFNPNMYTRVTGLNSDGVMVGFTTIPEPDADNRLKAVATVFENGESSQLFENEDIPVSYAMGINDNNYVVGFYPDLFDNSIRFRSFVYDRTTSDLTLPNGFFVSSSTIPRAINNNNLMVGEAESAILNQSLNQREVSGFLYDIENDTFTNLNDLLPCDSPYTIVSANDINDNDEIFADARVRVPAKNIRGEELTGSLAAESDIVVSVVLRPTGNPPSECEETDGVNERQGASLSAYLLLPLTLLAFFRRRIKA